MVAFYKSIRRDDHSPPRPIFIESTSQHRNIPNRNVRTIGIPRGKVGNILASKKDSIPRLATLPKSLSGDVWTPWTTSPKPTAQIPRESLNSHHGYEATWFRRKYSEWEARDGFLAHSTYNRTLVLCCVRTILYPVESWQHTDPLLSRWDAHLEKQWPLRWHFAVFDLGNIGDEIQLASARYIGITIKTIIRIPRKTNLYLTESKGKDPG